MRLAALPADQCITVAGMVDHMFFMEHRATRQALAQLLADPTDRSVPQQQQCDR
jgi:hypothetical protein